MPSTERGLKNISLAISAELFQDIGVQIMGYTPVHSNLYIKVTIKTIQPRANRHL